MKLTIIGGGISGCITAYLLSELGHEVSLYEKKDKLGGTIRDIKEKNEIFFNGPHYFSQKSLWVKRLKIQVIMCSFRVIVFSFHFCLHIFADAWLSAVVISSHHHLFVISDRASFFSVVIR